MRNQVSCLQETRDQKPRRTIFTRLVVSLAYQGPKTKTKSMKSGNVSIETLVEEIYAAMTKNYETENTKVFSKINTVSIPVLLIYQCAELSNSVYVPGVPRKDPALDCELDE